VKKNNLFIGLRELREKKSGIRFGKMGLPNVRNRTKRVKSVVKRRFTTRTLGDKKTKVEDTVESVSKKKGKTWEGENNRLVLTNERLPNKSPDPKNPIYKGRENWGEPEGGESHQQRGL